PRTSTPPHTITASHTRSLHAAPPISTTEATVTSIATIAIAASAAGAADRLAAQCRDRLTAGDIAGHIDADRTRAAGDRRATIATIASRPICTPVTTGTPIPSFARHHT